MIMGTENNSKFREILNEVDVFQETSTYDNNFGMTSDYVSKKGLAKYINSLKHLIPYRRNRQNKKVLKIDDAGFFSLITFSWMSSFIYKAYKKGLTVDDIPLGSPFDSCSLNSQRLESLWQRELKLKGPKNASFGIAVWKFVRTRVYVGCLTFTLSCIMGFISPTICMRKLLEYLENPNESEINGYIWVLALTCAETLRTVSFALYYSISYRTAIRLRSACLCLIYKKVLRLNSPGNTSTGEIVNLYSFDGPRLFYLIIFGPMTIGGPILSICGFLYIYYILGGWALMGMIIFVLYYPLQYLLSHLTGYYRRKAVVKTDKRIKIMTEILTSIKLIKMYAWENWFSSQVYGVRKQELTEEEKISYFQSIGISLATTIPLISGITTFLVHVATGGNLGASQAYTVIIILLTHLRTALNNIRWGSDSFIQGRIVFNRFQSMLMLEENSVYVSRELEEGIALSVKDGSFAWDVPALPTKKKSQKEVEKLMETTIESTEVLHSINMTVSKGALIGVCGSVGSGKSSLLLACLGRLKLVSGQVSRTGSCAYVSQESWLENDSLKNNILFNEKFDPKKYIRVLSASALNEDVNLLPGGDETEIGERGVNLSGGQKQRVALARALYSDRDIYFLDDPFSAVDSQVGVQIFENYVLGALAKKTVIIVTRQIQCLQKCDEILVMKDGKIVEKGTFTELLSDGKEFKLMIESDLPRKQFDETDEKGKSKNRKLIEEEELKLFSEKKLTQREEQLQGTVKSFAYRAYIAACGGYFICFLVIFTIFLNVGCNVFSSWWLAMWIKAGSGNTTIFDPETNQTVLSTNINDNPELPFYMKIYGSTFGLIIATCIIRMVVYTKVVIRGARVLHENLFEKLLKSPISYFERTPIGQIQNLVSMDVGEVDSRLPESVETMLQNIWFVLFSFLSISLVLPWFLIPLVFFAFVYYFISKVFRVAVRDLKRIESISRAPVMSSISTTVQGLTVIRAFSKEREYLNKFYDVFDDNSTALFLSSNAMRWMAVRLDSVSVIIIFVTSLLVVLLRHEVAPAFAGLALSYAAQICGVFQYTIRLMSENESRFISVERIQNTIKKLESEGRNRESVNVPQNWPSRGEIKFSEMVLSYGDSVPVLNGISFLIKGGEKIGVVGRTGAGKSSLIVALFRLVELTSGYIAIDGVNTSRVPLKVLRSRLSVIPQDPVLFSDTLRSNLDPFKQFDDGKLWEVLRKTKLSEKVKCLPNQMETYVGEGENLSVGEKQLLCLARTLLRGSKILVLDEATASIDLETEKAVQMAIQEEFKECTVITIAHRLSTVTTCDRILVIDQGNIVELDSPDVLMKNPKSAFAKMLAAGEMQ